MKHVIFAVAFMLSLNAGAQLRTGDIAPEIALPNVNDSIVKLSSFKGKVVLIDFWASWCGPCRVANPGIVKLYEKYKDKGLEVFSVSIDQKKVGWTKAIAADKIPYTQVNDKDGWDAKTATAYGVNAIPATFLVNKKGVIYSVDPTKQELEDQLQDLLK